MEPVGTLYPASPQGWSWCDLGGSFNSYPCSLSLQWHLPAGCWVVKQRSLSKAAAVLVFLSDLHSNSSGSGSRLGWLLPTYQSWLTSHICRLPILNCNLFSSRQSPTLLTSTISISTALILTYDTICLFIALMVYYLSPFTTLQALQRQNLCLKCPIFAEAPQMTRAVFGSWHGLK